MLHLSLSNFTDVRRFLHAQIVQAPQVKTERWQGKDVKNDPAAATYEIRNVDFEVPLQGIEDLRHWASDTQANVPWADDHFAERVIGEPLNPGKEWANWPWAGSAAKFRDAADKFNHTYMERLWPKYARMDSAGGTAEGGRLPNVLQPGPRRVPAARTAPHKGHAHNYGDLQDLVELLVREPYTRQAWIPLFFPEDTGYGDGGRKVCTLGYQLLVRQGDNEVPELHMWYPLRSCDLIRHFCDDCYLAVRLLLWVLDQCRARDPKFWKDVFPGTYAMHMTSLHIFENDKRSMTR